MDIIFFIVAILIQCCNGVIYNLNESDYDRMPPLYDLADYTSCLSVGGKYCTIEFNLVSDTDDELYHMIREYSAFTRMHFDYTKLLYGKCLTDFCPQATVFTKDRSQGLTLEACLNETFTKTYNLQTRVNSFYCSNEEKVLNIEMIDMVVGVCVLLPFLLAFLGSVRHFISDEKEKDKNFWLCFSVPRNVKALFAASSSDREDRTKGLSSLHGFRTITSLCVILTHACLPLIIGNDNPKVFEDLFKYFKYIASGTLVVQTFFIMSGFLLGYNTLTYNENHTTKPFDVPKRIFLRWLRLTPPVLFLLAIISTWLRFTEYGPMWQTILGTMVSDCRAQWWPVPLYYVNYVDHNQCMPELWYLAADFQLTILGTITLVYLRGRTRVGALVVMAVLGLVIPAYVLYALDLDIASVCNIQNGRKFFVSNLSFNNLYKRTHNNITDYVMGILTGMLVYHWQTNGVDLKKYPVLKFVTWLMFPLGLSTVLVGSVFYGEGPLPSVPIRILYLVVSRVAWGVTICGLLISFVFGIEKLFFGILSWSAWKVPARLSYSAYVVHVTVIRALFGYRTELLHVTPAAIVYCGAMPVLLSYLLAAPMWVFIEAPVGNLIKMIFSAAPKKQETTNPNDCKHVPLNESPSPSDKGSDGSSRL